MGDYKITKIGGDRPQPKLPEIVEEVISFIKKSNFLRNHGDLNSKNFFGEKISPVNYNENSFGQKTILIAITAPEGLNSAEAVMKYRESKQYQDLRNDLESLGKEINSALGDNIIKKAHMSCSSDYVYFVLNDELIKGEENVLNESTIREIVKNTIINLLKENNEIEYRTKGSLNKKTLEMQRSQADKTSGAAIMPNDGAENDQEFNPAWAETTDDILQKFKKDDEFDDTTANGEFKIDKRNPYFINKEGKQEPADSIGNFHNDFAIVKKNGQFNYINNNGQLLCDDWFDFCNDFEDGFGLVSKDKKRNFVGYDGQYLLENWVDRAGDFMAGEAPIVFDGQLYHVDRNGKISR